MKSFTEFPAGKLKSKITLRSSVSFLETVEDSGDRVNCSREIK
jgi:hypothetical protein